MKKTLLNGILCAGALVLGVIVSKAQPITIPNGTSIATNGSTNTVTLGSSPTAYDVRMGNPGNAFYWGSSSLTPNQGGGIELGGQQNSTTYPGGGQPFLDFHGGAAGTNGQDYNVRIINDADNQMTFATKNNGAVMVMKGASIGIGTISPSANLHVAGLAIIGDPLTATELTTVQGNFVGAYKLRLFVNGIVGAKEFRCSLTNWADDVFNNDYKLRTLNEVESFIKTNKHLPEVPSEKEVVENGVAMGEMMKVHMKKIEELTLYMIELQKQNEKLAAEVAGLKK